MRTLLETHYEQEGTPVLRIDLPKGSYVPRYVAGLVSSDPRQPDTEARSEEQALPAFGQVVVNSVPVIEDTQSPNRVPQVERHLYVAAIGTIVVLLAICVGLVLRNRQNSSAAQLGWAAHPFLHMGGIAEFPNWSPTGDSIAFAWSPDVLHDDKSKVEIRDVRTGALTTIDTGDHSGTRPAWSPSGLQLACITTVGESNEVRVLSLGNHVQRTVATLSGSYPWLCEIPRLAWTKDEQHIITADQSASKDGCRIFSIDVHTGARQKLTENAPGVIADVEPAVSIDGKHIAFLRNTGTLVGDIYSMNLDGTDLHRVTWENRDIMGFCWDREGRDFIFASRRGDGTLRLWQTGRSGNLTRLTDGLTAVGFPALSPDGATILFASYHNASSIWRSWTQDGTAQQVIADDAVNADPAFSPDGLKIAFRSDASGATEIWVADADGKNSHQLTGLSGPFVDNPTWSPDGQELAFDCRSSGHDSICMMPAQGGAIRHPVPWNSDERLPVFSLDGKALLFTSERSGAPEIYRVPLDSPHPEISPVSPGLRAAVIPTQGVLLSARAEPQSGLYTQKVSTSGALQDARGAGFLFPLTKNQLRDSWEPAPEGFWFLGDRSEDGTSKIFQMSLRDRAVSPVLVFKHPLVQGDKAFSVAPDGKSALLVEQGSETADLFVLRKTKSR